MQIIVPIYVHQQRGRSSAPPITARPLFFEHPNARGSDLGRVIAKLANKMRVHLSSLARKPAHDELLSWHHPEPVHDKVLKLNLDLRDSTASVASPAGDDASPRPRVGVFARSARSVV